ncbi:MAG TPA: glycosyltransferase [Gemmatimonadales bacterium]
MKVAGPPWEVVHCVFSLGIGGQEMVILGLIEQMDRSLFSPRVLCLQSAGQLAARFEALNVPVDILEEPVGHGSLRTLRAMVRYLRHRSPAVLHTHNPMPHQFGAIARLFAPVPVLVHTKHGRNQTLHTKGRYLERIAGYLTDAVVPVSADAARVAETMDRVPKARIRVIRNGVHIDRGAPRPKSGLGWRVVHVARLNRVKDQKTLLRAARIVRDHEPAFHLDLVGDGECRAELETLTRELDLENAVSFHGFHDDVQPFLDRADAFVLSSISEGIALTLLEAMAAQLPAVATDVGGNREVIVEGETGYLVPPRDPVALARAMIELLSNPARRARFGAAGRARVHAEFSLMGTVSRYEALYCELLAPHIDRASA